LWIWAGKRAKSSAIWIWIRIRNWRRKRIWIGIWTETCIWLEMRFRPRSIDHDKNFILVIKKSMYYIKGSRSPLKNRNSVFLWIHNGTFQSLVGTVACLNSSSRQLGNRQNTDLSPVPNRWTDRPPWTGVDTMGCIWKWQRRKVGWHLIQGVLPTHQHFAIRELSKNF
jgi:hypothetical protein